MNDVFSNLREKNPFGFVLLKSIIWTLSISLSAFELNKMYENSIDKIGISLFILVLFLSVYYIIFNEVNQKNEIKKRPN